MWRARTFRTKIDLDTGHCKCHDTHSCQTERDDEIAVLATVNLADHTGEIERILVDQKKSLCLSRCCFQDRPSYTLEQTWPTGNLLQASRGRQAGDQHPQSQRTTIQSACCRPWGVADARKIDSIIATARMSVSGRGCTACLVQDIF